MSSIRSTVLVGDRYTGSPERNGRFDYVGHEWLRTNREQCHPRHCHCRQRLKSPTRCAVPSATRPPARPRAHSPPGPSRLSPPLPVPRKINAQPCQISIARKINARGVEIKNKKIKMCHFMRWEGKAETRHIFHPMSQRAKSRISRVCTRETPGCIPG